MPNKLIQDIFKNFQEALEKEKLIGADLAKKLHEALVKGEYSKDKIEEILNKNENT